ncbi:MAG: hypothetical protein ACP5QA_03645 [Phycisphaerae bacterium]
MPATRKTRKTFSAEAFKHRAQDETYAEIKALSPIEEIAHFDRQAEKEYFASL